MNSEQKRPMSDDEHHDRMVRIAQQINAAFVEHSENRFRLLLESCAFIFGTYLADIPDDDRPWLMLEFMAQSALSMETAASRDRLGPPPIAPGRGPAAEAMLGKITMLLMKERDEALSRAETAERERDEARAALEFYANPDIYKPHPHGPAFDRRDLSDVARRALAARPANERGES
jgi:hypothetical protein